MSRTSQFNTTTLRLSQTELAALLDASDSKVHLATLSDKFGTLGIVGVVVSHRADGRLVFDDVVMSCRAMGFGLERQLIRGPIDEDRDITTAIGRYVATTRNSPCASLFADSGFIQGDGDEWILELDGALPTVPEWLHVERV
jgi:FkbH-like protein